ncbi:hypothetical protein CROQUDRAFT_714305 [Cronartium quercuum f. sp. fusiforme G11]|uniref:Uncharacterized protein n=1 Tax=Cronartium quercuum f. sp. fusiforme G11 TaxID=708437 RepID=A0A9P6TEE7_9BASI|nr:hypothetical protein CROQUDRAFT_714305 [Cronartium quercuum f. sp. fusiforme G11]
MPINIDVTASSMTGLLGAVEASKANLSKRITPNPNDDYNLSRFSKGSKISKQSKKPLTTTTTTTTFERRTHTGKKKGIKQRVMIKDEQDHLRIRTATVPPSNAEQLAMDALERKAKIYEATIQGRAGGLSDKQLEGSSLDIEAKRAQQFSNQVTISDTEDEQSTTKPLSSSHLTPSNFTGRLNPDRTPETFNLIEQKKEEEEEDWIETRDEFGRTILIPSNQLPKSSFDPQKTMSFVQTESANHLKEVQAEYGPQKSFPVLDPSSQPKSISSEPPINKHFDPKLERRQLGTGYYTLSNDPIERQNQLDQLRSRQTETERVRASKSSVQPGLNEPERAIEHRKRQIQLKRDEIARKKLKSNHIISSSSTLMVSDSSA